MPTEHVWMWAAVALSVVAAGLLLRMVTVARALAETREHLRQTDGLREELATARSEAQRVPDLISELRELRGARDAEMHRRVAAETQVEALRNEHAARMEELRGMKAQLEDRFAALASGVLEKNSASFLKLVSERFQTHQQTAGEELDKRRVAIEGLVKPLSEKLGVFDQRIKEIEQARNEAYGAIKAQVAELAKGQASLGTETRKLVQALRAPKTRGRWGEMQLRQVFEMAGMAERVDYTLETHIAAEGGALRPDAVVRIPGGKSIVVDAKTPLEAYLDALEASSPEEQQVQLTRHAAQVRSHVKLLASKKYQEALAEAPDFVVMFIPGETFVSAAAEADAGLIEYAFENKVLIATPTTLMALVKAIAYGWQQEKMAENAAEVQRVAKELYDRLSVFAQHLDKVGRALTSSVKSYNSAVGSLEGRVLPSARKFERLGVIPAGGELATPEMVESEPREVSSLSDREASAALPAE